MKLFSGYELRMRILEALLYVPDSHLIPNYNPCQQHSSLMSFLWIESDTIIKQVFEYRGGGAAVSQKTKCRQYVLRYFLKYFVNISLRDNVSVY